MQSSQLKFGAPVASSGRRDTHVAPTTAKSAALAFVSRDTTQVNTPVDTIMTISRAVRLTMELQITTGASSRKAMSGLKIARATMSVLARGKM